MKNTLILVLAAILLAACGEKKLTTEQAKDLLKKNYGYPKAYTIEINRIDPASVQRLADAGLETEGVVTLMKDAGTANIGKPKIFFTEKAKPFLTGPTEGETADESENVKVADVDVTGITGVATSSDGKTATVEYLVGYTNFSPFKALIKRSLTEPEKNRAYFRLFDDGWRVDKTAEASIN